MSGSNGHWCLGLKVHKFEPRYTEEEINHSINIDAGNDANLSLDRELFVRKVYVYDICVYCGEIRKVRD